MINRHSTLVCLLPAKGGAPGIKSIPASIACSKEECERIPSSLCLPASPMSTKINLKY